MIKNWTSLSKDKFKLFGLITQTNLIFYSIPKLYIFQLSLSSTIGKEDGVQFFDSKPSHTFL